MKPEAVRAHVRHSGKGRAVKLAQRVAEDIELEILERGWPAGEPLGTERALQDHHGVSRSVLREALALVEQSGLAEVRRGKVGGLFVADRGEDGIAEGLTGYLEFISPEFEEILALRVALEEKMMMLAAQRLDDAGVKSLQALTARRERVSSVSERFQIGYECLEHVARAAQSPLVSVFVRALVKVTLNRMSAVPASEAAFVRRADFVMNCRMEQTSAVVAVDLPRAFAVETRLIAHTREALQAGYGAKAESQVFEQLSALQRLGRNPSKKKLAGDVARQIRNRISQEKLSAGDIVGSEDDLRVRYDVSRGVMREAIRLLERLSIAEMIPGKNGGLRVAAPNAEAIIANSSLYLRSLGVGRQQIWDTSSALDMLGVAFAAERAATLDRDHTRALLRSFAEADTIGEFSDAYCAAISDLSGSPTLALLMGIVGRLIDPDLARKQVDETVKIALVEGWRSLIVAILAGDAELARRRLLSVRETGTPLNYDPRIVGANVIPFV